MADIKKFLDQAGVSTLWSKIAEELEAKQSAINAVDEKVGTNADKISTLEGKVEALEKGTYDDTEVRGLIADNKAAHEANATAIATLNGDAETAGSVANTATGIVATKIAEVVAGADASFDTLKEIADWILNDTTGAANMANKIAALESLVGDVAVATQIANAIDAALKVDGANKFALASDLVDLADRVKALEDAGYMNETAVNAAIDSKITALKLAETYEAKGAAATAETNAKAYADSLAVNYDAAGDAEKALAAAKSYSDANLVTAKAYSDANLVTAKSYTDTEVAKIQALTPAEIDAAIASAKANA
jgi:hypothetical protein